MFENSIAYDILISMIKKHTHSGVTWVDLESPSQTEIKQVMKEFNLHPLVAEELLVPTLKPKVELFENYIYLILHFPALMRGARIDPPKEVDFVIGRNFIITSRFATVEPIMNFSKIFETNSILEKGAEKAHAGLIFYYMIKKLYRHSMFELEKIRVKLCDVENMIFEGKEKEMVVELSKYSRELLDFKQILGTHIETLESFEIHASKILGEEFNSNINAILGEYKKVCSDIVSDREFLSDLRETNDSLLNTKQNETMKILTIMAFVTFPLSLITDLFSMNTAHSPIVGLPYDFEIIMVIMFIVAFIMFGLFKFKKWL
ncbi:MAG: hypothetical protein EXS50_02340 [Candidatus Taylorbacteria bacterium]|nr:hypothetical protein [Candidatus Taylorbacteria bacterium]